MITAKQLIEELQKIDPDTRILVHDSEWGHSNARGVQVEEYTKKSLWWDFDDKNEPPNGEKVALVSSSVWKEVVR